MQAHGRPDHERRLSPVAPAPATALTRPTSVTGITDVLRRFAFQDWYIVGFCVLILFAVVQGNGPERDKCIRWATFDVVAAVVSLLLLRGQIIRGFWGALLMRFTVWGAILGVFFQLTFILPEVSTRVIDADILAFDMAVFHYEPAVAWDRFVTPATTEWFSFFYYGYFFLIGLHAFPFTFIARKNSVALNEFGLGVVLIFCTAHLIYMLVPGFGPHQYLAGQFVHPLEGDLWWKLVRGAVDVGGSRKDIFPSLHTCAPTFLAIFSFRHRKMLPFKYVWPFTAFFASQMVLATMFLRWHYLIDICAGLLLAVVATIASARIARWERERRERLGLGPVWLDLY